MIRGSYLFGDDKGRIIQDPETMRASSIRQASAWQAWAQLRDDLLVQLNSSDHNPAIRVDVSPSDSWDLSTPEMMKYYVKGGKYSNGKHGFIFSNANWDPYPISNDLEAFTIAMANMGIVIWQRDERFSSEFFTGPGSQAVLRQIATNGFTGGAGGYSTHEVWQDLQAQINPVPPEGYVGGGGVEELEAQSKLKAERAMRVVEDTYRMLATDLIVGTRWLDVRKAQDASRQFGPGPTAAWTAFRKVIPLQGPPVTKGQPRLAAIEFLYSTPAWSLVPMEEPK
jgi:histidine ammonia-lyase